MTTESETAQRTPHQTAPSAEAAKAHPRASARASVEAAEPVTQRHPVVERLGRIGAQALTEFTPPGIWTDPPATLAELSRYARYGAWTTATGFWRTAGVCWYALFAVPVSCAAYYLAWIVQRPARAVVVSLLYVVVAHTRIGQALLPWPTWLP